MRNTVAAEHRALPAMLVVAVADNENPEIREEDYAEPATVFTTWRP